MNLELLPMILQWNVKTSHWHTTPTGPLK